MKEEQHEDRNSVHINLGAEQRNAGRDYHEVFMPGSVKLLLAARSQARLDQLALDNSRLFRYRFGFEPPRVVRQQVLEIQKRYDLTDREVRWLRHAGQLQISHAEAKLVPTRLVPAMGWVELAILSVVCIGMVFQISFSTAPAWKQALGQLFVTGFWFAGSWVLNNLCLAPWRTLKRTGAIS